MEEMMVMLAGMMPLDKVLDEMDEAISRYRTAILTNNADDLKEAKNNLGARGTLLTLKLTTDQQKGDTEVDKIMAMMKLLSENKKWQNLNPNNSKESLDSKKQ